ncbi:hypothetical protein KBD13_01845 [Patescibacteria group bacterium]|nr:hypothetical protein [Patescibacteria group bacterium]
MKTFLLIVGMVVGALFAPGLVEAGVCGVFCEQSITISGTPGTNTSVQLISGSQTCTTSATCPQREAFNGSCPAGTDRSTVSTARAFCLSTFRTTSPERVAATPWCDDLLDGLWEGDYCRLPATTSTPREGQQPVQQPAEQSQCSFTCDFRTPRTPQVVSDGGACTNDGSCASACIARCTALGGTCASQPAPVCGARGFGTPPVTTGGTAPGRTEFGQDFRCSFLCAGSDAAQYGGTCSGTDDVATCTQACNATCPRTSGGGSGCVGVTGGVTGTPQQAPRCVATQAPTPSVGGITDTGRFESLNESFTSVSVVGFIGGTIKVLIGIAGSVFFLFMVWGGIRWMMAGGDPGEVSAAKSTIQNAMIGVILLALSYTIVTAFLNIATNFVPAATRSSPVTGERPPAR